MMNEHRCSTTLLQRVYSCDNNCIFVYASTTTRQGQLEEVDMFVEIFEWNKIVEYKVESR